MTRKSVLKRRTGRAERETEDAFDDPGSADDAVVLLLRLPGLRVENGADGFVKHVLEVLLRQRRALEVANGADLPGKSGTLLVVDRRLPSFPQLVDGISVFPQVELGTDKKDRNVWCVMLNFGNPLSGDVLERRRADDAEADEEDVGLRVREGSQSIVIFLTGGIP